jgi:hypothetical protein
MSRYSKHFNPLCPAKGNSNGGSNHSKSSASSAGGCKAVAPPVIVPGMPAANY